jgi:hypothetical protein
MLFNKRTRNIIKYMWAIFATLIAFSMVFAYSGFTSLSRSTQQEPIEIPAEVREQLRAQQMGEEIDFDNFGRTPEELEVLKAIEEGRIDLGGTSTATTVPEAEEETPEPEPEPEYSVPQRDDLKLEI